MSYQPVDLIVLDTTVQKNPVQGVVVRVYSQDGKLFFTQETTDANGHVGFLLNGDQTYQLRFFKFGVAFKNPRYMIVKDPPGPDNNQFEIDVDLVTPPVPADGRLCTAFGFFRRPDGSPAANVDLHFIPKFKPLLLDGSAMMTERAEVRTDDTGYVQINLVRNGQYDVTVQGLEDMQRCISVPDAPNVNLPDLLFPVVAKITFSPAPPITLSVGQQLQVTPTVFTSDGNLDSTGAFDVTWSTDDPNIVGLSFAGGVLTLNGNATGTANITAVRNDQTIVRIPDTPIVGIPLQVTVQ